MKKFFAKVKDWFVAHKPSKRRLIQVYAALLYNAQIKGFFTGKIYTGDTKKVCVPGLNCYSCPGAVGACPLGALQDSLAQSRTTAPAYIFGILILFGLLLGRIICGFLCPFGLIQELLYKIRTPKLRKSRFTRILSYFKYVLLVIVIAIPIIYAGIPSFCKYICPAGTVEGAVSLLANIKNSDFYDMLGYLFTWKFCVLVAVVVASVFIYRFFCRFICPLGAIYSLFCKVSLLGVKLDKNKCIDCGLCIQGCKMDIKHVGDHECIQCGECISVCPVQAISWKGSKIFLRNTSPLAQPALAEGESEKIALLEIAKSNAETTVSAKPADAVEKISVAEETAEENVAEVTDGGKVKVKGERWQKIKAAFKRPRFVVEFVAWTLATVLLITALICYNLPDKGVAAVPAFTVTTYKSAVSEEGERYSTGDGNNVKILYFWRTDLEESVNGMEALNELATSHIGAVEVVAIHSIYKDQRNVQEFIDERGWDTYNLVFAQDDMDTNAYSLFGGDISVPKTVTAVISPSGALKKRYEGTPDTAKLKQDIIAAQVGAVYGVGDYCPLFTLGVYNKEEGATYSVADSRGKVVVLNFWYTGCDPCKNELPEFESVYEEYAGEIDMTVIHNWSGVPTNGVQNFLDNNVDKNGRLWASYEFTYAQDEREIDVYSMLGGKGAFPMTVILDTDGKITFVKQGPCSDDELRSAIEAAKNK